MKVTKEFNQYRWAPFAEHMTKEEFRDLQAGKDVKVDPKVAKKYPHLFKKELKNGNK